jgi:hypothetical protein
MHMRRFFVEAQSFVSGLYIPDSSPCKQLIYTNLRDADATHP